MRAHRNSRRVDLYATAGALTAGALSGWLALACDDPITLGVLTPDASVAIVSDGSGIPPVSTDGSDALPDAKASSLPSYILGADITWTQEDEAAGATYYDEDGTQKPILTLLADHGFNFIRLRTFVDPTQPAPDPDGGTFAPYSTDGFGDLAHTIVFGQKIKQAGFGFLLDFHYSDYWADPAKQIKPAGWVGDDLTALTSALYAYTSSAISQLVAAGARPDMVQVGNDITPGIELTPGSPLGSTSNWPQLAQLLRAGISGIHDIDPTIEIALHLDRCADLATSVSFINDAMTQGVSFDVFGQSCYVVYEGKPSAWKSVFDTLATTFPNLRFMAAEYNADPSDSTETRQANDVLFDLPNHQGAGTFIWEPTRSGAWGPGLFVVNGEKYSAVAGAIDPYDQMKVDYGL